MENRRQEQRLNQDGQNRTIDYLRISVTDRCNLRCRYCMPYDLELKPHDAILRNEEILRTVRAAADFGIRHLKVTGGEPLVRLGCTDLVHRLKKTGGIETVTLTTNGVLLPTFLEELKGAGIDGINISLDTLDRGAYTNITGFDRLNDVLKAIDLSVDSGIRTKINVTVTQQTPPHDIVRLVELAKDRPLDVRFIELMPIGFGADLCSLDNELIRERIRLKHPGLAPAGRSAKCRGYGPAQYWMIPGFQGQIGFISAIHEPFCAQCNRLRLTSSGFLKYCLCYEDGIDLRQILRSGLPEQEERRVLFGSFVQAARKKPERHSFSEQERITEKTPMSGIGG